MDRWGSPRLSGRGAARVPARATFGRPVGSLLVASALGLACSALGTPLEPCTEDADCRGAFGWGSVCLDDGLCSEVVTHPRCTKTYPEDLFSRPEKYRDAVLIGAAFSYVNDDDTAAAAELAVRQIRARGGEGGIEFALVTCDTTENAGDELDDMAATREVTRYLAQTLSVPAILATRGSERTLQAWSVVEDMDILMISPSATSPALTEADETSPTDEQPGRLWRTVPPDSVQSQVMAQDIFGRGVVRIAIIEQVGAYGDSLSALLAQDFTALGGQVVETIAYDGTLVDAVADAAVLDVQEVVVISSDVPDYINFLNAASSNPQLAATYDGFGMFFPDAAYNERIYLEPSASAEIFYDNIRGSRPAPATGSLYGSFTGAFVLEYGKSPDTRAFAAHAYDAAYLIMYASLWARAVEGEITGTSLARGLRKISDGPALNIRTSAWPEAVETLGAGIGVDVSGASGLLDYDPATEETTAPIELWAIVPDGDSWIFASDGDPITP